MAGAIQRVNQDRSRDTQDISQVTGVFEFLFHRCQTRVIFSGMGFVSVDENRIHAMIPVTVSNSIHGWRRHPTVWSGEAAELGDRAGVLSPNLAEGCFPSVE